MFTVINYNYAEMITMIIYNYAPIKESFIIKRYLGLRRSLTFL